MPLEISSLRELPPENVAAMTTTLAQLMQERHPEVELTRGVFHDLVLYFNAVLNAAVKENIDRILQSRSLLQIIQNPALAEAELVDNVLSNFNLSRNAGAKATGTATFVFLLPLTTTVGPGVNYTGGDAVFIPAGTYTVLPPTDNDGNPSVATKETERVMRPIGDGTYAATIPFVADAIGVAGNIRRGETFRADSIPGNISEAFAASDFTGGKEASTNEEYLALLSTGLAAATIGGRKSYEKFIKSYPAFRNILHCSVLGCGDSEQQRDQHSLFPISGGGKVDIYLQTTPQAQENDHILEATYIGVGVSGTIWQVAISRDISPGFYEVSRVAAVTDKETNGYAVIQDIRGVNLAQSAYTPDIMYDHEGAYTRYQTAIIRFEDSDKLSSGLTPNTSKAFYAVRLRGMPLIADVHDTLTSRDNRPRAADLLVKAAVPCFTKISFAIRTEMNETISDETIASIKAAVVDAVANVGFSGQLHSSVITNAAHKFLTGRQAISSIDMFGRIRRPDGTAAYVRDNTLITIPNDPTRLVTGRTTAFLVGLNDVAVSYTAAGYTI
jgi:hypothetical protein